MSRYLLVVESDAGLQQRIGDALRQARYELASEAEAAWARRSLAVRAPDGIVLATQLADGSGFDIADELRRDPETRAVPIFFVGARHHGAAHAAEARRRFAPAEYLAPPVDVDSLLALVLETVPPREPAAVVEAPAYTAARLADAAQKRERAEVEQAALEIARGDVELRGSIAREPFARVLQRIYSEHRTGALHLERGKVKKIVYFADGYPVAVRSNLLSECLGQILLDQKMISQRILDESLRRMKAERKQQGAVLVEMNAVSPYNLGRALLAQMEAKLYELFAWPSGNFSFVRQRVPPRTPTRFDKSPAALILEGVRRHYDEARLRAVLEPFTGQFVIPSPDPFRRLQDLTADPAERRFMEILDGQRRLEAVLAQAPIPVTRARLLLAAMAEAGMIVSGSEPVTPGVEARLYGAEDAAARPDDKALEDLAITLEALRGLTHFEALGIHRNADVAAVDRAYESLAREFHPDRFRARGEDVRHLALAIFERLGEARAVLRDPARRRGYLDSLGHDFSERPVTSRGPDAPEQIYLAGVAQLRSRQYAQAARSLDRAVAMAPARARYRGALAWALYRSAPADAAAGAACLRELRRAIDVAPKDPTLRISLARFFTETGHPDEAIAEYQAASALDPSLAEPHEEIRRLRGN